MSAGAAIDLSGLGLSAELVPALERLLVARAAGEITVRQAELLAGHLVLGEHAAATATTSWYRRRDLLRSLGIAPTVPGRRRAAA